MNFSLYPPKLEIQGITFFHEFLNFVDFYHESFKRCSSKMLLK